MFTACQTAEVTETGVLPTLAVLPSPTPSETPSPTLTDTPLPAATATPTASLTATLSPTPPATATPSVTPTLLPELFSFGVSVEGRPLLAHRLGTGPRVVMLVGGVHTGFEANTVELVNRLVAHFQSTPGDIMPGITLVLVPVLNPDGLERGRTLAGRFNASGVDLNRNWGCGWAPEAEWREGPVDPGPAAFSEPETLALAGLITQLRPAAVLFYHAAARGVFRGGCEGASISDEMAQVYGLASGYPAGEPFSRYPVTGSAPAWVDSMGFPAADVELATSEDPEFWRNLRGVMAVQAWAAAQD